MVDKEPIIPAVMGNTGICPRCKSPLHIMQREDLIVEIDIKGHPTDIYDTYVQTIFFCDGCWYTTPARKSGDRFVPEDYVGDKHIIKYEDENPFGFRREEE